MKRALMLMVFFITNAIAVETFAEMFSRAKVKGNVKYYYIETNKDLGSKKTSAHGNSLGGKLNFTTEKFHGLDMGVTFMTTNPFALPHSVDTSIIGRDNAVQLGLAPGDVVAQQGFSTLGEAYLRYSRDFFELTYGRQVINTPFINAKEVRMLPTAVQGTMAKSSFENGVIIGAGYLDRFKQRTSSEFVNVYEHALGSDAEAITGTKEGFIAPIFIEWYDAKHKLRLYDYFAENFMNTIYADVSHEHAFNDSFSLVLALQALHQEGLGNANEAMDANVSKYGGAIRSDMLGAKLDLTYASSALSLAYTTVLEGDEDKHSSLVMPFDGTPLFTDTITSNDLFTSNYGQALTSSGGYIAGTSGVMIAYRQKYDFSGIKGIKSAISYAQFDNKGFDKAQQDINAVLAYGYEGFSIALKGIWVANNSSANKADVISQIDSLTQYRVIANYKF